MCVYIYIYRNIYILRIIRILNMVTVANRKYVMFVVSYVR